MAENLQQINPVVTIVTELVSTGVMGIATALLFVMLREERKRSMVVVDRSADLSSRQIEGELVMANALKENTKVLEKVQDTLTTSTMVIQSLSDRISIVLLNKQVE